MGKQDLGAIAERLFTGFMAPLVLGGEMHPGRPIGGRAALTLGVERTVTDADLHAHVQLARVRRARRIAPVDGVPAATPEEWALAACLHDLVQTAHPALVGLFRGSVPNKLLAILEQTLELVPAPRTIGEALARHTWFARTFEIERTDTVVKWWAGSASFLGTTPPERMTAWPGLRRVHVDKTPRPLVELPARAGAVDRERFARALTTFLGRTPLTDLATLDRAEPVFAWSAPTLSLVASRGGRTLVTRTLHRLGETSVMAALGQATRALLVARAWTAAQAAFALLSELVLASAQAAVVRAERSRPADAAAIGAVADDLGSSEPARTNDAALARAIGATVARAEIEASGAAYGAGEREALIAQLVPLTRTPAMAEAQTLLAPSAQAHLAPAPAPPGSPRQLPRA